MLKFRELLQSAWLLPALKCLGLGLAIFLAAWWRDRRSPGLSLLLLGLAWALCHLIVDPNSYVYPPKDIPNWLVFGALALVPVALISMLTKHGAGTAAVLAGALLGVTAWFTLQKEKGSWLMDRHETPRDLWLWTSGIISAVLAAFGSAEAAARKVPALPLAATLAAFAALAGLAQLLFTIPDPLTEATVRLFAVAGLAAGAAGAAALHSFVRRRPVATLPPGIAGWIGGGTVLLFILACLSRFPEVPLLPMEAAAGALPLAAILLYTFGRTLGRAPLIFIVALLLSGASLVFLSIRERDRPPAGPTGADDTGAYDDL